MQDPDCPDGHPDTQVMNPTSAQSVAVPTTPEGIDAPDFLENFSPQRGGARDDEHDAGETPAAWIADMFENGEDPVTPKPPELPGSAAHGASASNEAGMRSGSGEAGDRDGRSAAASANDLRMPGVEIPGFTAEMLGAMMRAFARASSQEGRERNPNVKLAKMPTHGDRTLPSIKARNQWYDVRLTSWAGAQAPRFVEAIDRYVKHQPDEKSLDKCKKDNRLLAYELCAMVDAWWRLTRRTARRSCGL